MIRKRRALTRVNCRETSGRVSRGCVETMYRTLASRKKRIAKGSGTSLQEVNQLLKQFNQMSKMMKMMQGGGGKKMMQMMQQMMDQQKGGQPPQQAAPAPQAAPEAPQTAAEVQAILDQLDAKLLAGEISESIYEKMYAKWEARLEELGG